MWNYYSIRLNRKDSGQVLDEKGRIIYRMISIKSDDTDTLHVFYGKYI